MRMAVGIDSCAAPLSGSSNWPDGGGELDGWTRGSRSIACPCPERGETGGTVSAGEQNSGRKPGWRNKLVRGPGRGGSGLCGEGEGKGEGGFGLCFGCWPTPPFHPGPQFNTPQRMHTCIQIHTYTNTHARTLARTHMH